LIGAEASVRFGQWLGRGHYQGGFHQTATAGAFGACVAAARLMGLSHTQTENALAITASRAAGLKAQFGSMAKPYHAGLAAETGVVATTLAQKNFVANPLAVDGPTGFGATHMGAADDSAFNQLGQNWLMEDVSHKYHACCHGTHAMIEALLTLPRPVNPVEIKQITINTHKRWMNVCNITTPETGLEVKFSYAHLAAMVLTGHDCAALHSYNDAMANDPALTRLAAKVGVCEDAAIAETASQITLKLLNGDSLNAAYDLNSVMDFAARREKILHKAAALLGKKSVHELWLAIDQKTGPDLPFLLAKILPPEA